MCRPLRQLSAPPACLQPSPARSSPPERAAAACVNVLPATPRPLCLARRVVRCRTLEEETSAAGVRGEALRHALAAEDTAAAAALYVLLRAADRFHAAHQRFPGVYDRWGGAAGWRLLVHPEERRGLLRLAAPAGGRV